MNNRIRQVSRQSGVTLIELMIGLGLGILLLFGVGLLFTQNKQSYLQNEAIARLQEEARFAIEELARDLSMAGFIAETVDTTAIFVGATTDDEAAFHNATGATFNCGPTAAARNWFYDFQAGLVESTLLTGDNLATGAAAQALYSCIDPAAFQPNTDAIGIKRTSGTPSGFRNDTIPAEVLAPAGRVYVRENGTRAVFYQSEFPVAGGRAVVQPYRDWEYSPKIYYVRNFGVTAGDGVPTLCRIRLVNDGTGGSPPLHTEECIAQGVEDLQIEYGLDTLDDGSANVYVRGPAVADLPRVVSVRIYLLMRTINEDVGYRDDRTYVLSNKAAYTPGDRFHRRIYASTIVVQNVNDIRRLSF
ncbi:MAG TPA: PilW family protein [Gammaproteobacteria bacterium]|nr:PilW family protein [Gammaproteobacteria bacterium]